MTQAPEGLTEASTARAMTHHTADTASTPVGRQYAIVSVFLIPAVSLIAALTTPDPRLLDDPRVLLGPVFGMLALTASVWLMMLLARHLAVITGRAPIVFFRNFDGAVIADWIERPARTFNNLMQLPTVFYATCALMIQADAVDNVQLSLAWFFVVSRCLHAFVFVGWNDVKWRFATALVGFVAMGVIVFRFAVRTAPLWLPG